MKALSGLLLLLTVLGGMVTVAFTIHGLNPNAYGFLPDPVLLFMTEHDWIKWFAAGVLVVSVLLRIAVERAAERAVRDR